MSNKEALPFEFSIVDLAEDTTPTAHIKRGKDWVLYGEYNDYFNHVIELYKGSSINKALVDSICRRIYGNGLAANVDSAEQMAKIKKLLPSKEVKKIVFDYKLQGNAFVKIRTNRLGVPIEVYHTPCEYWRTQVCNEEGEIEGYYYSADWSKSTSKEYKPELFPAWNPNSKKAGVFIYHIKEYTPDSFYYGQPDYSGSTKWIECDVEIGKYHLSNIKSGFSAATIVQLFNGMPTHEQRVMLERKFKEKFTGSQGSKIVFMYNQNKDQSAEITQSPIPEADKQYEILANESRQNILIGHRITSPMLLGIRQETGLGNNADEIRQADNLLQKVVIDPYQNDIADHLQEIVNSAGISASVYFQQLGITETQQVEESQLSAIKLSDEQKVIKDKDVDGILSYLDEQGESEDYLLEEGFEVVAEDELEGDDELKIAKGEDLSKVDLMSAWGVTPDNLSKYDVKSPNGDGVWLVRYQYDLAKELQFEPKIIDTSRKFCRKLIDSATTGNRVYKREVLERLNNPEFGSYNIFWYKGSYNCRHVWKRKLYFKSFSTNQTRPVGNVPYVVNRVSDKRATTKNRPAN